MKNTVSLLFAAVLCFALVGCGSTESRKTNDTNTPAGVTDAQLDSVSDNVSKSDNSVPADSSTSDGSASSTFDPDNSGEEEFVNNEDFYGLLSAEYAASGFISFTLRDLRSELVQPHAGWVSAKICGDLVIYDGSNTANKDIVLINLNTRKAISLTNQIGRAPQSVNSYAVSNEYAYVSSEGTIYAFDSDGNLVNSVDTTSIIPSSALWAGDDTLVYSFLNLEDKDEFYVYIADETLSDSRKIEMPDNCKWVYTRLFSSEKINIEVQNTVSAQTANMLYDMKTMESQKLDDALMSNVISEMSIGKYNLMKLFEDGLIIYDADAMKIVSKFSNPQHFIDTYFGGNSNVVYNLDTSTWERVVYGADGSITSSKELGKQELPKDEGTTTPSRQTLYLTQVSDKYYLASQNGSIYLCTYEGGADSAELIFQSEV